MEFTVDKAKKGLSITVSNTTDNSTVQGIISTQAIGNVTVTINGETKTIEHKGGLSIFTWDKLPVGYYTATATLLENGDYYSVNATTNFEITRDDGLKFVLIANSTDVKYGEDIKLSADITSGATGNITYTYINGTVIGTFDVGKSLILHNVRPGFHTIIANYSGDDIYNNDSAMIMFIVNSLENGIKISVENVTGVDYALITITGSVNGEYTLTIGDFSRRFNLKNGTFTYNVTGFPAGHHTVMVNYTGNLIYKPNIVKAHFSVNKADVNLKIIILDMKYNVAETGYIFSTVDGVYKVFFNDEYIPVIVSNGVGEFHVGLLGVGEYTARVVFEGSEYYNTAINETTFNVYAGETKFDIGANATNITYGESVEIYVANISTGVSGTVNYYLSNGTFLGTKSSIENLTLSDLNAGTYGVIANFTGDENINSTTSILKITVNKVNVTVTIKTENVTYGENSTFNITGPNGTYGLILDENIKVLDITTGNATENVGILSPGIHYAMIYYGGDENHAEAMEIVAFEVYKLTPKVTVETNDINYKEEACVNITSDVSGIFYVKVAGQTQSVILTKDEKQTLVFRGLYGNESGWIIGVTWS